MQHPRLLARGTREVGNTGGTVVYAPDARRARWVASELERCGSTIYACATFAEVFARLVEATGARPQVLVVDYDALAPVELFALQSLRERGWFGSIIAVGAMPSRLATSLSVHRVLRAPLVADALRDAIERLGHHDVTVPIAIVTGSTSS